MPKHRSCLAHCMAWKVRVRLFESRSQSFAVIRCGIESIRWLLVDSINNCCEDGAFAPRAQVTTNLIRKHKQTTRPYSLPAHGLFVSWFVNWAQELITDYACRAPLFVSMFCHWKMVEPLNKQASQSGKQCTKLVFG